ncbi:MAG TPA: hypothetical protein VK662_04235 [Acidothermaceae bacterium]|nr:hypothetical protein [Acidothermaceae bacterium]
MSNNPEQPKRRRHVIRVVAPAFGLLAAGLLVWQGSYAAFSATTTDTNNTWSSGLLTLLNNGGTATYSAATTATFGGTNLRPGATGTTCLTVKSSDFAAGTLAMYESSLADSAPSLGAQIQLTVTEGVPAADVQANCTGFPAAGTTVVATNQPLSTFPTTFAAATGKATTAIGPAVLEAYKVVWTFVSTGTNPGDSALMGKTVTAGFTWELQ